LTIRAPHREPRMLQQPTNWVPKPIKAPSMQVFELSIDPESLAASGRRGASNSRASPEWCGRFHAGQLHPRSGPKVPQEIQRQATAARRIRIIVRWQVRRVKRVIMVAPTSKWAALLATTPRRQALLLFHLRLHQPPPLSLLLHERPLV
jgi:hypothetical protein